MKAVAEITLAVLVMCLLFCGCKGYRETDSEYFVSSVCFEKTNGEFTVDIEVLSLKSEEDKSESKVFSAAGKTVYEAADNTVSLMPKNAVFDHCGTAVIGSALEGEDLKSVMEYLYNTKNLNLGIRMFVSEDIKSVLYCESQAMSIGYDILAVESNINKISGVDFKNKYYEVVSRHMSRGGFCLPKVENINGRPGISGEYLYVDFSPAAALDFEESIFYNIAYSGSSGGEISVGGKRCRVDKITSKINRRGDTLEIDIKCRYRHKNDKQNSGIKHAVKGVFSKYGSADMLVPVFGDRCEDISGVEVSVHE